MKRRPLESEYDPYYAPYLAAVPDGDVIGVLVRQCGLTVDFIESIAPDKATFRYAPDKWSVSEVLGHVVDTERVFSYRALRIARGDKTPLAGMDQNDFIAGTDFNARGLTSLSREFQFLRSANIELFESFTDEMLDRRGIASGLEFSARALMYLTAGHAIHHIRVLKERYL